ncbi:hypothetical protein AB0N73_06115 [Microbacterium sp. NPDC089189]|uniref:hypothetical protein n=1 Tax=Microbacterium sp. NPDC089189 TaxID=3154972 RepID=UPI00341F6A16
MEPLLEFLAAWWWTAPTAAGLGAVGYAGLTTGRRRSRRLALDAARHQEQLAVRALLTARADTRSAQAQVQAAKAARAGAPAGAASVAETRRRLQQAKDAQRAASLALRATRLQVRAERAHLHAAGTKDETPLARLTHEHDAIAARWLEYETDLETSLAFPQMSDPHHPATAAFLVELQRAQHLRPSEGSTRVTPEDFVAYREAVHRLDAAFTSAEDAALRATADGTAARAAVWTRPATRPGAAPPTASRPAAPPTASRPTAPLADADPAPAPAASARTPHPEPAPAPAPAPQPESAPVTPADTDPERPAEKIPLRRTWPVPSRERRRPPE